MKTTVYKGRSHAKAKSALVEDFIAYNFYLKVKGLPTAQWDVSYFSLDYFISVIEARTTTLLMLAPFAPWRYRLYRGKKGVITLTREIEEPK